MEAPSLGDTSTWNLETWSCGASIQASLRHVLRSGLRDGMGCMRWLKQEMPTLGK